MPIDKAVNAAPSTSIEIEQEGMPDIEVILEEDGGATVEIGEEEDKETDFYANLAELVDPQARSFIALDLLELFESDKSSRAEWETMYAKGLDLLGFKLEERTQPFRGASGAVHPMLTDSKRRHLRS